jgi:fluoroacetyl-CoA thioesterase
MPAMKYRTGEATLRVISPDFAEATQQSPESTFVPATSRMIELMEMAAARLMKSHLGEGESSVAVAMNVTYAAASLRHPQGGSTMRAVASYNGTTGRLHRFRINAFDESGLIGTAEHTRAVVIERRLTDIAPQQAGNANMMLLA